uniref:Uncharacterized protein n=1 Tax=viral metagenome TaxID=1070528 RepID=A0A6M3M3Y6_9ZZZZ
MDHDEYIRIIIGECRIPSELEFLGLVDTGRAELLQIIATLSGISIGICTVRDIFKEVVKK